MSKNVEYTLDENGKIVTLTIDGKPAKAGWLAGIKKAQTVPYWHLFTHGGFEVRGISLTPFQYTVYNFTQEWQMRYDPFMGPGRCGAPIQTFDRMRDLFRELDSDAYMDILD
jgi:hypothetical protein